jgi:hypothetical protein
MFISLCPDGQGYSHAINLHRVKIRLEGYGKEKNGSQNLRTGLEDTYCFAHSAVALMQLLARETTFAEVLICMIMTLI